MKERALDAAMRFDDPGRRLNSLREYLQAFVMRSLHESEASRTIAFVGGTALRFLENLPRFSEDLDFSQVSSEHYAPVRWRWFDLPTAEVAGAGWTASLSRA